MIQPAFPVVCDNCLESSADWYAVGDLWIGAECWDPFGDFAHLDERRSRGGVDGEEGAMLITAPSHNSGTPASCGNRTGGMADWIGVDVTIVPTPPAQPSPEGPNSEPVKLGDLLPDVLAEMRRLQREAGR